ncbi:MAG: hypothetical protein E6G08_15595 [Actinobacteria bacterium]|nr:MAG: hypothetical protein E6G08_15595 [Actinomycetota bacterium]
MTTRTLAALAAAILLAAVAVPAAAADPPPGSADCVAQFVTDFQNLFPGFTIGDVQGHLGLPIPGYLFPTGGQAHFLQPFGELLKGQATAAHNACPFDLTP